VFAQRCKAIGERKDKVKAIERLSVILLIILFVWFLASWMNVISHNDPEDKSAPAAWNCFVVMTEVGR